MKPAGILVIAGPTGSGKSALAARLAAECNAEIVSADAFQVYQGTSILTAQPSPGEREAAVHHLVDCIPPGASFSAADYARQAGEVIRDIQARGRLALVTGGAGFYLSALFGGGSPAPPPAPGLREALAPLTPEEQWLRLQTLDPQAAHAVDRRNPRRVQRALEVVLTTGRPFADFAPVPPAFPDGLVLNLDRAVLHRRMDERAAQMLAAGAIEEVAALGEISDTCAQIIGLREIRELLAGKIDQATCLAAIQQSTHRYARRQITWFRHQTPWPLVAAADAPDWIRQWLAHTANHPAPQGLACFRSVGR